MFGKPGVNVQNSSFQNRRFGRSEGGHFPKIPNSSFQSPRLLGVLVLRGWSKMLRANSRIQIPERKSGWEQQGMEAEYRIAKFQCPSWMFKKTLRKIQRGGRRIQEGGNERREYKNT